MRRVVVSVAVPSAALWTLWDGPFRALALLVVGGCAVGAWLPLRGIRAWAGTPGRLGSMRSLALILVRLIVALALSIASFVGYGEIAFRVADEGTPDPSVRNALWAAHRWVREPLPAAEYQSLARTLAAAEIGDVFFHVGPLRADGTVDPVRSPAARALIRALKPLAPQVRLQAWLGQVERRGGGPLDLSQDTVRASIVRTAASFLRMGFEGIHYDIEPIYPGNRSFLALLEETRRVTRAHRAVLSVAAEDLDPIARAAPLLRLVLPRYHAWTRDYFRAVSRSVDQIAVMSYDTALPTGPLYASFLAWQTAELARLVGDRVTVFMGVPTYDDPSLGHHPGAENARFAIRGIRKGTARVPPDLRRIGIAVFAEWTTDPAEWELIRRSLDPAE